MSRARLSLAVVLLTVGQAVWAGPIADLFDKKPKPSGPDYVQGLIATLQTESHASKRAKAAEELSHQDGQAFPEILPALMVALQTDQNTGVRREAATALGRLKPASQEALQALEQATEKDESGWVRLAARSAKLGYKVPPPPPPTTANKPPSPPDVRISNSPLGPRTTHQLPLPPPTKSGEPGKFLPEPPAKPATDASKDQDGPILIAPKKDGE